MALPDTRATKRRKAVFGAFGLLLVTVSLYGVSELYFGQSYLSSFYQPVASRTRRAHYVDVVDNYQTASTGSGVAKSEVSDSTSSQSTRDDVRAKLAGDLAKENRDRSAGKRRLDQDKQPVFDAGSKSRPIENAGEDVAVRLAREATERALAKAKKEYEHKQRERQREAQRDARGSSTETHTATASAHPDVDDKDDAESDAAGTETGADHVAMAAQLAKEAQERALAKAKEDYEERQRQRQAAASKDEKDKSSPKLPVVLPLPSPQKQSLGSRRISTGRKMPAHPAFSEEHKSAKWKNSDLFRDPRDVWADAFAKAAKEGKRCARPFDEGAGAISQQQWLVFSLFDRKMNGVPSEYFTAGMMHNLALAKVIFPEWRVHMYLADNLDATYIEMWHALGVDIELCSFQNNDWMDGMFWRFYPMDLPVKHFIVRDPDGRLSWRDRFAVEEWTKLSPPTAFHILKDSRMHTVAVMGGMWGAVGNTLGKKSMVALCDEFQPKKSKGDDQKFLQNVVWRLVKDNATEHTTTGKCRWAKDNCLEINSDGKDTTPHATDFVDYYFIGAAYGQDRIHNTLECVSKPHYRCYHKCQSWTDTFKQLSGGLSWKFLWYASSENDLIEKPPLTDDNCRWMGADGAKARIEAEANEKEKAKKKAKARGSDKSSMLAKRPLESSSAEKQKPQKIKQRRQGSRRKSVDPPTEAESSHKLSVKPHSLDSQSNKEVLKAPQAHTDVAARLAKEAEQRALAEAKKAYEQRQKDRKAIAEDKADPPKKSGKGRRRGSADRSKEVVEQQSPRGRPEERAQIKPQKNTRVKGDKQKQRTPKKPVAHKPERARRTAPSEEEEEELAEQDKADATQAETGADHVAMAAQLAKEATERALAKAKEDYEERQRQRRMDLNADADSEEDDEP